MRLLFITQKLDPADPILAFTIRWVEALAARVDHLHVLCLESPKTPLPKNVTAWSMGKDRGLGRIGELREFYRALLSTIHEVDAVISHMIPRYTVLAAPITRMFGKKLALWYTHRHVNTELKLAVAFCTDIFTAVSDSFPLPTKKLHVIGHGIDTAFFSPAASVKPDDPPLITHVARLMPIKHQETLIRAIGSGINAQAAIVGNVPPGQDESYLEKLKSLASDLGISERINFTGGLDATAVRDLHRRASISVNLSPPGLFDKAALESMLIGVPTVVSNPAFDSLLGEYSPLLRIAAPNDVEGLAHGLRKLLALPREERQKIGATVRERVKSAHSLDDLMEKLVTKLA